MQRSELSVEDQLVKSRSFEPLENRLSLLLESITLYVPITKEAVLPHVQVEGMTLLLPLYLSSFIILQDLLLDYTNEVIQTVLQFKLYKREARSHHHSSSSLNFMMGTSSSIIGMPNQRAGEHARIGQKQSFLQKGATRVKKMATSMKNVASGNGPSLSKKIETSRTVVATLSVKDLKLHVQVSKALILSYTISDLLLMSSKSSFVLNMLDHSIQFARTDILYTDYLLNCPKLPELVVVIEQSTSPVPSSPRAVRRPSTSTSSSNLPPVIRPTTAGEGGMNSIGKKSAAASAFNSSSGIQLEKESRIHVNRAVDVLKIDLTTKQVNQFASFIVGIFILFHPRATLACSSTTSRRRSTTNSGWSWWTRCEDFNTPWIR